MRPRYRAYPGSTTHDYLEAFKRDLGKSPKPPPPEPPRPPMKRVLTAYGLVEMPVDRDPEIITGEDLIVDPLLRRVSPEELPSSARSYVKRVPVEPVPDLMPTPNLTAPQLNMLQVIGELGETANWSNIWQHYSKLHPNQTIPGGPRKVRDALLRRKLITEDGKITALGSARLRAQDAAERLRDILDPEE